MVKMQVNLLMVGGSILCSNFSNNQYKYQFSCFFSFFLPIFRITKRNINFFAFFQKKNSTFGNVIHCGTKSFLYGQTVRFLCSICMHHTIGPRGCTLIQF